MACYNSIAYIYTYIGMSIASTNYKANVQSWYKFEI